MKWQPTLLALLLLASARCAAAAESARMNDAELQSVLTNRAAQAGRGVVVVAGLLDETGRRIVVAKAEGAGPVDGDTVQMDRMSIVSA